MIKSFLILISISKMPFSTQTGRMLISDVVSPTKSGKYFAKYGHFHMNVNKLPESKVGHVVNNFTPGKFFQKFKINQL